MSNKDKSKVYAAIRNLKLELNNIGAKPKLTVDGDLQFAWGPKCEEALKYGLAIDNTPNPAKGEFFGAPWMGLDNDLLGRDETDAELNARFVPGWKHSGLPGYKSLIGVRHAFCIMTTNYHLVRVGLKGTGSAGASSLSKLGKKCPFWFGAFLDILHKKGGRHACEFLYWIDEAKRICATRDANRSNKFDIFITDLSGKGDTLVSGPRWPMNHSDGQFVSKKDVLEKYPFFKVGKSSSSDTTR
jgi:hypothetical protein